MVYRPSVRPLYDFSQKLNDGDLVNSTVSKLKELGSADELFAKAYNSNPRFRRFADQYKGVSPEQAFSKIGLDFAKFSNYRW